MALKGNGYDYNPRMLNNWLRANDGYSGNDIVWGAVNSIGLKYEGKIGAGLVKNRLDQNKIVIINVNGRGHWVLAYGYSRNSIKVNDPLFARASYSIS